MGGYLGGKYHERIDRFLVKHFNRPDREQRFENRRKMAGQAAVGTVIGLSYAVGTGRVRAGGALVKAGHKQIVAAATPLTQRYFVRARTIRTRALANVPRILSGAELIGRGAAKVNQGRFLQHLAGQGLLLYYLHKKGWF